jgi:UrcA family protein
MKPFPNMTFATLAGLASLTTFVHASPGSALLDQAVTDQRSITVHFGDLDPHSPADASALVARVKRGSRNACLRDDEQRQIFLGHDRKHCIAHSYASAIAGINAKRNVDIEAVAARHEATANLNAAR